MRVVKQWSHSPRTAAGPSSSQGVVGSRLDLSLQDLLLFTPTQPGESQSPAGSRRS